MLGTEVATGRTWKRFWKVLKAVSFSKPKEAMEHWVQSQETAVPLVRLFGSTPCSVPQAQSDHLEIMSPCADCPVRVS